MVGLYGCGAGVANMTSRNILNIRLLGIVSVLGLAVIFSPRQDPVPIPAVLPDLSAERIVHVRIDRLNRRPVILQRRNKAWYLVQPNQGPANEPLVNEILKITRMQCSLHYATAALELTKLSLQPAQVRLTLNQHVLAFGTTTPLDHRRYIQANDRVYLCNDRHYHLLTGDPAGFRAPSATSAKVQ